ncbi:MAG: hypothetical protein E7559_04675 [Ruminococcaceae bacterium]|nr:hypothetical protein [Oscillospiraceae bacterium]
MKRCVSIILALVCLLTLCMAAGCKKNGQPTALQEQFMEDVQRMGLLVSPDYPAPENTGMYTQDEVIKGIIFLPRCYELYCHAYTLLDHASFLFYGSEELATAEEVRGLFLEFDEEVYARFCTVSDWYLLLNGSMYMQNYNDATAVARDLYNEKYGENIMPGNWTAWSLEDRIALETFVRDNPDFMPAEQYEKELRYLGIDISESE